MIWALVRCRADFSAEKLKCDGLKYKRSKRADVFYMVTPKVKKTFTFHYENGLHARIAAMIVEKAYDIQKENNVRLFICKGDSGNVPLSSLLILTTLKIKAGDTLTVISEGKNAQKAVNEMVAFLNGNFQLSNNNFINKMDSLIQDNVATAEQIFNSIATGLIVVNEENTITFFNPVAEKIFGLKSCDAVGKNITCTIPGTGLEKVVKTGLPEIDVRQNIGKSVIVKSSTPIFSNNGYCIGAVCIFEDISKYIKISWQLKEIRELKEKYRCILESMQEGICVLDKNGDVTYINPAYKKILDISESDIIGKNIDEISPDGARSRTLHTGETVAGNVAKKRNGTTVVSNVNPLIIDGEISGAVSVVNDITKMQQLMESLNRTSAKAEYYENELQRAKPVSNAFSKIIGSNGKLVDAIAIAEKAAKSVYTVLIRGESGTGKELFAEAIHYAGNRSDKPFIRVNCAAIPAPLLESELFGHEKGAFTGAVKAQMGKFELANKGSIFLDEIGDMEENMQAKLLRFLQNKEFQRVGGEKTICVDVKIIAATNKNLEKMVREGKFREDLYYRLNVIPIFLPPLRDRKDDIPQLTEFYIKKISGELHKKITGISPKALKTLMRYGWPGNIRELENVLKRSITLIDGECIEISDLPDYVASSGLDAGENKSGIQEKYGTDDVLTWETYEKQIISRAIKKYGSYNAAAKALGVTHKTVAAKAKKYGIGK